MDRLIYLMARTFVGALQCLPMAWVVQAGRAFGTLAWWIDGRHRRVALSNLSACLGREIPPETIRAIAHENFRRLGENYLGAIRTSAMSDEELAPRVDFADARKLAVQDADGRLPNRVVAIGHFGNFEVFARLARRFPGLRCATTYRGFEQRSLDQLMQSIRARSGCQYFERRRDAAALRAAMNKPGLLLGLLSDQHAGDGGIRLPFLGLDCSTSAAPAIFALRYRCPLHVAICYRVRPGHWRIEVSDEIPTRVDGRSRGSDEIMRDVNVLFEAAIRADPANWFWVHRRWKPAPPARQGPPVAPAPPVVPVGEGG